MSGFSFELTYRYSLPLAPVISLGFSSVITSVSSSSFRRFFCSFLLIVFVSSLFKIFFFLSSISCGSLLLSTLSNCLSFSLSGCLSFCSLSLFGGSQPALPESFFFSGLALLDEPFFFSSFCLTFFYTLPKVSIIFGLADLLLFSFAEFLIIFWPRFDRFTIKINYLYSKSFEFFINLVIEFI